jgi:hypothetical protein
MSADTAVHIVNSTRSRADDGEFNSGAISGRASLPAVSNRLSYQRFRSSHPVTPSRAPPDTFRQLLLGSRHGLRSSFGKVSRRGRGPGRSLDLFIDIVRQGDGKLSQTKRMSQFPLLTEDEIERFIAMVNEAFHEEPRPHWLDAEKYRKHSC